MKELNVFCFIMNIAVVGLVGVLLPIVPTLTRKSFLFGVKVPPEQSGCAEAREMKRRYIGVCVVGTALVLALVVAQFALAPDLTLLGSMYFPLLFVAVQLAAFVPNHGAALRLKEQNNWQVSNSAFAETKSSFNRGNLSSLPWFWYIASVIVVAANFIVGFLRYPSLPERIPTHWDLNMQPNAWSDKSVGMLLLMPIINLSMVALLWAVAAIPTARAKLQVDANNPALSFAQHRAYRSRMGNMVGLTTLSLAVMFMLLDFQTLFPGFTMPLWLALAIAIAPCALLCVVAVRLGQGGCKIKIDITESDNGETALNKGRAGSAMYADDRFWALGMFYHNPDDPAILVENRFGGNIGFNYSRLPVKIGAAIGIAATVAIYAAFTVWWLSLIA